MQLRGKEVVSKDEVTVSSGLGTWYRVGDIWPARGLWGSPQSWEYSVLIHVLLFIYLFSTFFENLPLVRPDLGSWANVVQQALTEQSLEGNCSIAR